MKLVRLIGGLTAVVGLFTFPIPARAVSTDILIYQVQTRGVATDHDLVQLVNTSLESVDVSGWCVQYVPESGNLSSSAVHASCVPIDTESIESGEFLSFASIGFVAAANEGATEDLFSPDVILSGLLNHTSGHVRLLDESGLEVDRLGWGSAVNPETFAVSSHNTSQRYRRVASTAGILADTDNNSVDFEVIELCRNLGGIELPSGFGKRTDGTCFADFCPNIEEVQEVAPEGYEKIAGSEECVEIFLEDRVLFITELYPNAPSTDSGKEFVELFNPHAESINLVGYRLQVGPSFTKELIFNSGSIPPTSYATFSDVDTGIVLPNSTGVQLRLLSPAGTTVSESPAYQNADDDVSWALVDDVWVYTNQLTPNAANKPYVEPAQDEVLGVTSILAPCPAGKYRNPDTNRCRNLETAVSTLQPCDEDEYRNPDTNRCRKLATASSSLVPCDEGEERNPTTNRCRKVSVLAANSESELPVIEDVAVQNTTGSVNWGIITLALATTLGYMLYEWRHELRQQVVRMRQHRYNKA